jgi:hypothetical protein
MIMGTLVDSVRGQAAMGWRKAHQEPFQILHWSGRALETSVVQLN